ncbi:2,3-bisphosphoglycerate-independent phosphoglycerate mutase, partial [Candidatus Uhrbacteria bacterium]|nr:2,3-bisphosphoglycerate-independent phosphoglycerate mutase [Candidatus Uhrbacteria bacterium]
MPKTDRRPLILISLDGWGISPLPDGNAIEMANKPNMTELMGNFPFALLEASGISVGLPWGEVGNSEVGHLNLGAGQVIYQNLPRINIAIQEKSFFNNQVFLDAIEHCRQNKSKLHFIGITSNGGVHGHIDHLHALLQLCQQQKFDQVFVHAITDGRDTPPAVAANFLTTLQEVMRTSKVGRIASVIGRFYGMDRNNNWDRTQKAYDLHTKGTGIKTEDPLKAVKDSYQRGVTDEQLEPIVVTDRVGTPLTIIAAGDAVIFFNFRPDRARQLTQAYVLDSFKDFDRGGPKLKNLYFATMMSYQEGLPVKVAFLPQQIQEPLGKMVSDGGLKQLRLAETEKYAHVTYFFNGGNENVFKNEDRAMIPSPDVTSYDQKPEMSAIPLTDKLIKELESDKYDFIMVNFANADMVGHTGNLNATIKGVETVDTCLGKIIAAAKSQNAVVIITADHGNAEIMIDMMTGGIDKEHSTSPVPFILYDESRRRAKTPEE